MAGYHFEREARTPYSEMYTIDDGEHSLGRVDVHYTASATHATLNIHQSLSDEQMHELLVAIDEEIVSTADPYREDLIVTVWRGEEVGVFADDEGFEDEADTGAGADDMP